MALEDILSRIRRDAEEKASTILREGEREKREALDAYRRELEAFFSREMKKLEQKSREREERMSFHVRREAEREVASARRALMDEAIEAAVRKLSNMGDREYLDAVAGLIEHCGLEGDVDVVISKGDEGRVTQAFLDGLPGRGMKLRLSDERHGLEKGGVILRGDGVSVNATFAMITRLAHEELVMALSERLEKVGEE